MEIKISCEKESHGNLSVSAISSLLCYHSLNIKLAGETNNETGFPLNLSRLTVKSQRHDEIKHVWHLPHANFWRTCLTTQRYRDEHLRRQINTSTTFSIRKMKSLPSSSLLSKWSRCFIVSTMKVDGDQRLSSSTTTKTYHKRACIKQFQSPLDKNIVINDTILWKWDYKKCNSFLEIDSHQPLLLHAKEPEHSANLCIFLLIWEYKYNIDYMLQIKESDQKK